MRVQRISLEESIGLVPCEGDYREGGFKNASYYTIQPGEDGWDHVKYFTDKNIFSYTERDSDYDSWVYILSNPTMPGLLKIGHTKKDVNVRAKELSRATGVPKDFEVEFAFQCFNGEALEKDVHSKLKRYRSNNRKEFFQISLDEAKDTVISLGERYIKK